MLKANVNIVFHSAATVRFDQSIKEAVNLNTLGSKRLWDLCSEMQSLRSIIHVSTAYTNPTRKTVDEIVYPPNVTMDLDTFIKCAETLPDDLVTTIATHLQVSYSFDLVYYGGYHNKLLFSCCWFFFCPLNKIGSTSKYIHNHKIDG